MKQKKINALKKAGWQVGNAADFMNLSQQEAAYVELKVELATYLQHKRKAKNITQTELAHILHSSQSRVAKIEKNDPTVSLDLLFRSLFAIGTTRSELAKAIS
jgi:DNA-binding XRE family transcriptional regulator